MSMMDDLDDLIDVRDTTLVDEMVKEALREGAAHVHIEDVEDGVWVRHKIGGHLKGSARYSLDMSSTIFEQIRAAAGIEEGESTQPLFGVIQQQFMDMLYTIEVCLLPGIYGDKAVLTPSAGSALVHKSLDDLSMLPEQVATVRKALGEGSGLIVIAGPTRSGTNTTAYAMLLELDRAKKSVASIEVASRGQLPQVHQIKSEEGFGGMASTLRSVLRTDHDVLYVRELADRECVDLVLEAVVERRRLVVTTIHTASAIDVLQRLGGMGVEPWLLSRALTLLQGQRLLQRLCVSCRSAAKSPERTLVEAGLPEDQIDLATLYNPVGCSDCDGSGYAGQLLVSEVLPFDLELQELVLEGASPSAMSEVLRRSGAKTLRSVALDWACKGMTSLDEVLLHTPG